MKILDLNAEAKATIEDAHEEITRALNAIAKANRSLEKLTKQRDDIVAEIERLEGADVSDAAAMRLLGEKRTALGLIEGRIAELPAADPEPAIQLQALLGRTVARKAVALAPTIEAYVSEIAEKILPYCTDAKSAAVVARQTQACASLIAYITRRPGLLLGPGPLAAEPKRMLAELEEILAGELNWSFAPKA